jgi:hypothetical protein
MLVAVRGRGDRVLEWNDVHSNGKVTKCQLGESRTVWVTKGHYSPGEQVVHMCGACVVQKRRACAPCVCCF